MSWTLTTLNVNGLRSAVRKGFTSWQPKEKCDVLCLQELRMQEEQMEKDHRPPRGWQSVRVQAEKKGYSGVAAWSRLPVLETGTSMDLEWADKEGRCCWLVVDAPGIGPVKIVSLYIPSGSSGDLRQSMKDEFLEHWLTQTQAMLESGMPTVVCGDYNIAHREIDIHNPKANKKLPDSCPMNGNGWTVCWRKVGSMCSAPAIQNFKCIPGGQTRRARARPWLASRLSDCHSRSGKPRRQAWISRGAGLSDHAPVSVQYRT